MLIVFGSINVDFVMRVSILPRPGETVIGGRYLLTQGGKGANQACAAGLARLNTDKIAMIGAIGPDSWGVFALERLGAAEVDLTAIRTVDADTGCASILVDDAGENAIAVASGANMDLAADAVPKSWLGPDTILLLQMEVSADANFDAIRQAKRRSARIVVNVAPARSLPQDILASIDVLIVNEIEARMVGDNGGGEDTLGLARKLSAAHDLTCVVTLGAAGALAVEAGGRAWRVDALPIDPVDTTGAGDCFIGALAAALDADWTWPEALRYASVAAALACQTVGAQTSFPDKPAILERIDELPMPQEIV